MSTSWTSWARNLAGLNPTTKLIVFELALLADSRGVAIVPLEHLSDITCRSRQTVLSALRRLENLGHLRQDRQAPTPFRGVRLQLVQDSPQIDSPIKTAATPALGTQNGTAIVSGSELRELLVKAVADQWEGQPAWDLAATIEKVGFRKFGGVISRRNRTGAAPDPWDTLTLAWEVARREAQTLIDAQDPWALWVHLVSIAAAKEDQHGYTPILIGEERILESMVEAAAARETTSNSGKVGIGIDDFESGLLLVVETLMDAGLKEPIAWAGTARILELVQSGKSRRHWLAGRDAKLQALGINEKAARTWMTMLVGSRRGREGVLGGRTSNLPEQAQAIAAAM